MKKLNRERDFGTAVLSAMRRRAIREPVAAAVFPCSEGDNSLAVVKKIARSACDGGKSVAVLDFSGQGVEDSAFPELKKVKFSDMLDEKLETSITGPSKGVLWVGMSDELENTVVDMDPQNLKKLITRLEASFDIICANGPSVLGGNMCEIVAEAFEQCYIVVRQEVTTQFQLHYAVHRFRRMGIEPAGLIMNDRRLPIPSWFYRMVFGNGGYSNNGYH